MKKEEGRRKKEEGVCRRQQKKKAPDLPVRQKGQVRSGQAKITTLYCI